MRRVGLLVRHLVRHHVRLLIFRLVRIPRTRLTLAKRSKLKMESIKEVAEETSWAEINKEDSDNLSSVDMCSWKEFD
jgi:hypothetical protein